MTGNDVVRYTGSAILAHRLRSFLTALGIAIGIAAVTLLTSIGEGVRLYIVNEFTQFGTNIIAVMPGKAETAGLPGAVGGTIEPLTLADAKALENIPGILHAEPLSFGSARVEFGRSGRSVFIYGVTSNLPEVWKFRVRQGAFLPDIDPGREVPLVVLGPTLKRELFGQRNALGEHVRIGGRRFRVVGIMEPKGRMLGFDIDDAAYIPVASAMSLFNQDELREIDVIFAPGLSSDAVSERVRRLLLERHRGEENFTIVTQDAMLETLGNIIEIISFAVGAIGGISLVVGAIGILTMMWISVNERTAEIGLAMALGATRGQIVRIFLVEAIFLSLAGGVGGLAIGYAVKAVFLVFLPELPLATPILFVFLALLVSAAVGLLSGILPARKASGLDPVVALAAE